MIIVSDFFPFIQLKYSGCYKSSICILDPINQFLFYLLPNIDTHLYLGKLKSGLILLMFQIF